MPTSQEGRFLSVTTPLGKDVLLLESFAGREELSSLFEFRLGMLSHEENVAPADIIGKGVAVQMHGDEGLLRTFHGFVRRFAAGELDKDGYRNYEATIVPWLWFLTKRSGCRIFQDKTVVQIIEQVFEDAGFSDYETTNVTFAYPALEYCVQYCETDFDFVSRLLEEEGIFYSFRFDEDRHVLVLSDGVVAYQECDQNELHFEQGSTALEHVSRWEHRYEFVSGKWSFTDYDFKSPQTDLFVNTDTVVDLASIAPYERYEYPGKYVDKYFGDAKIITRLQAEEVAFDVVEGESACHSFTLCGKFKLVTHPFPSEEKKGYVLTSIDHSGSEGSYRQGGGETHYRNSFLCIPDYVTYRAARRTPKPLVHGPQTAVVVGPSGEEIHTDEYGRIKVQFHWDREGKEDESSSCWVRVAQSVAGRKWGAIYLPRIGQEVVVEFLEGDPDRPLVTGCVYNADNMPINDLPANKTQSGIKTRSSKDGGAEDSNEIRFEDKKGSEHLYIRAQRNEHHRVASNRYDHVGNEEHRTVAADKKDKVEGDRHSIVEGDDLAKVAGNRNEEVEGDQRIKIVGADDLDICAARTTRVASDDELEVGGSQKLSAGMDIHREAGMNVNEKAGMNFAVEGGMNVHLKAGMNVVVEAGVQLTLKAGGNFITVGPAGVDISGMMVKINSGGAAGSGSGCKPQAPGTPTAPDEPEEADAPMAKTAGATGDRQAQETRDSEQGEAEWAEIESAEPTPQAAALESAAATGQPLCES